MVLNNTFVCKKSRNYKSQLCIQLKCFDINFIVIFAVVFVFL